MKYVAIKTDRFLLRSLSVADVNIRYHDWLHSQNKSQYIEYSKRSKSIDKLKEYVNRKVLSNHALLLGIFDIANNVHIGNVKYEPIDFENRTAVMGILIGDKNYRGIGVAPEVIKASSIWLKNTHNITSIILGVSIENDRAINAYKKIGFITCKEDLINSNLTMCLSL
jgi:[ribosomal protein S5]-alanine N-acetyltransferase